MIEYKVIKLSRGQKIIATSLIISNYLLFFFIMRNFYNQYKEKKQLKKLIEDNHQRVKRVKILQKDIQKIDELLLKVRKNIDKKITKNHKIELKKITKDKRKKKKIQKKKLKKIKNFKTLKALNDISGKRKKLFCCF